MITACCQQAFGIECAQHTVQPCHVWRSLPDTLCLAQLAQRPGRSKCMYDKSSFRSSEQATIVVGCRTIASPEDSGFFNLTPVSCSCENLLQHFFTTYQTVASGPSGCVVSRSQSQGPWTSYTPGVKHKPSQDVRVDGDYATALKFVLPACYLPPSMNTAVSTLQSSSLNCS